MPDDQHAKNDVTLEEAQLAKVDLATAGGFRVTRVQSQEVYDRYTRYLTGCADMFRVGYVDVNQFTCEK